MTSPLRTFALSCGAAAALTALPATALAQDSSIPPLPLTGDAPMAQSCAVAKVHFRESVWAARTRRQATVLHAQETWRRAAAADLAAYTAEVKVAATRAARRSALVTYRSATAVDRATRHAAIRSARVEFRSAVQSASRHRRADLANCP